MNFEIGKLTAIGAINLILFLVIFLLLQNPSVYHRTLGKISQNYENSGGWGSYAIKKVSKPYLHIKDENFERWDADILRCVKENMYADEEGCYTKVRGAFFPLFPFVWKLCSTNSLGISLLNSLIFMLSIALLIKYLLHIGSVGKLIVFSLLVSFPSTIIYYIPYTEAFFLFTMTVLVIGIIKQKYWIYFCAAMLLAMVRPATVFVLLSVLIIEFIALFAHKNFKVFIKETALRSVPFVIGFLFVILIQHSYSSSWTTFLDAQKHWQMEVRATGSIVDWSVEGFSLSSFSIFFICLPALGYIVYSITSRNKLLKYYGKNIKTEKDGRSYLFLISTFYLTGIFVFTLLTSGGNLHSFFRFTLSSPFFYIAMILLVAFFSKKQNNINMLLTVVPAMLVGIFLYITEYGGNRFDFSFAGLYLSIITFSFLLFRSNFKVWAQVALTLVIVISNIVWNTYMLNIFFSNGWIFT